MNIRVLLWIPRRLNATIMSAKWSKIEYSKKVIMISTCVKESPNSITFGQLYKLTDELAIAVSNF